MSCTNIESMYFMLKLLMLSDLHITEEGFKQIIIDAEVLKSEVL